MVFATLADQGLKNAVKLIVLSMMQSDAQKQSERKGEHRVWYLMLLLGIPYTIYDADSKDHLRIVRRILKPIGVKLRRLLVHWPQRRDDNGRYFFRFLRYKRDDQAANRLAESFLYALSLIHGPMIDPAHDSLILLVPDTMVHDRDQVSIDELVNLEKSRPAEDRMVGFPYSTLGTVSTADKNTFENAWRIAGFTFGNEHLFEATRFLKTSHDNFYIYPGQIREVVSDPERIPLTTSNQTHFEIALQNAFKAIEAVIGDPPKDKMKFFKKLRKIGVDPFIEAELTIETKKPIHQVIRDMNQARDKKSAHGSTRNRAIKVYDMLIYQECSSYIVKTALDTAMGASLFAR